MSTPTKRRARRLPLVAVVAAAFGLFLTLGAGNAFALSCSATAGAASGDGHIEPRRDRHDERRCRRRHHGDRRRRQHQLRRHDLDGRPDRRVRHRRRQRDADHRRRCRRALRAGLHAGASSSTGSTRSSGSINLGEDIDQADRVPTLRVRRQRHADDQRHPGRRCGADRRGGPAGDLRRRGPVIRRPGGVWPADVASPRTAAATWST